MYGMLHPKYCMHTSDTESVSASAMTEKHDEQAHVDNTWWRSALCLNQLAPCVPVQASEAPFIAVDLSQRFPWVGIIVEGLASGWVNGLCSHLEQICRHTTCCLASFHNCHTRFLHPGVDRCRACRPSAACSLLTGFRPSKQGLLQVCWCA